MTESPRSLLGADELAQELGVTESTVRRRYQAGQIPGHPVGKNGVVFLRDELVEAGILPKPQPGEGTALAEDVLGGDDGQIVRCAVCGAELGVHGSAVLEHQDDGSHVVSPAEPQA